MLRTKNEILRKRKPNREALERIKKDIITARSGTKQTIEDLVIKEIKNKHKDWLKNSALDTSQIDPSYNVLITDSSIESPFIINSQLIRIIRAQTRSFQSKEARAKAIYNWIEQNIEYGKIKPNTYVNSKEVLSYKRGICAEMAFLYIAMTRSIGLKSNFVSVDRDNSNKKVNHACAVVETERGLVFVDPAYHTYDIKHRRYRIWKDKTIMDTFGKLRRK